MSNIVAQIRKDKRNVFDREESIGKVRGMARREVREESGDEPVGVDEAKEIAGT